ncbi:diguanylate cyclase [Deinococcus deserti]|uniref:GGDEF domain-containing protein n=1 Tax=Deinococcus deserti TaxID=310783 RepID=UPI000199512E
MSPDFPGLLLLDFLLILTGYLTLYGDTVQRGHLRTRQRAHLAATDRLKGSCNRRSGEEKLETLAAHCMHQWKGFSVSVLDLGHFKTINDSMGHERGDQVLEAVAHVLNELTGPDDVLVRCGGQESLPRSWQGRPHRPEASPHPARCS